MPFSPRIVHRRTAPPIERLEFDAERVEGYVVRTTVGFGYADFATHVAKVVRENHVQSDEHWMHQPIVPNGLASGS